MNTNKKCFSASPGSFKPLWIATAIAAALPAVAMAQDDPAAYAGQDSVPSGDVFTGGIPSRLRFYWDNTLNYNFGVRAKSMDDRIGNNPNFDESEYKFSDRGDVVTNRISLLSEFGGDYGNTWGFRISAQGWHDFAYNDRVRTHPGVYAPAGGGLPEITYEDIRAYSSGRYDSYVDKYYASGGQLLDAFAYYNADFDGKPVYFKVGRLTQYWGNALYHAFQGISYSQGALDGAAAAAAPGTQAKALFIPRTQFNVSTNLTPTFSLGLQYFFEYRPNRLPEGGTYLAPADFLFNGQDQFFAGVVPSELLGLPAGGYVPLLAPRIATDQPDDTNNNYGVYARWQSTPLRQWGFYYRRFDEVQPWAPLLEFDASGTMPVGYYLNYNEKVDLFGISLDAAVGNTSLGLEASYVTGKALNTTPLPLGSRPGEGARGDVVNVIGNVMLPLGGTRFYHTGQFIAEAAYTRVLSVESANRDLYNGTGYAGCASGNKWDGCSTTNALSATVYFEPQWLQVFAGVDLSAPITVTHGIYGNPGVLGGNPQGSTSYSIGVTATFNGRNTLKLAYVGSHAHTNGIAYTPSGLPYFASGNGNFAGNDRDWVSLTFSAPF